MTFDSDLSFLGPHRQQAGHPRNLRNAYVRSCTGGHRGGPPGVQRSDGVRLVTEMGSRTGIENLAGRWGVFAKACNLNQRVLELDEVDKHLYLSQTWATAGSPSVRRSMRCRAERGSDAKLLESLYLGPDITREEAVKAFDAIGLTCTRSDNIAGKAAALLAAGKVVAARRKEWNTTAGTQGSTRSFLPARSRYQQVAQRPPTTQRMMPLRSDHHGRACWRNFFPRREAQSEERAS